MLSAIIPSYKDPLLHKTIDSILDNAVGEVEINVVLDGYWPEQMIRDDPRIRILHLNKNRGMRGAINAGVLMSTGDVLMRTDEHCSFAKGFDKAIIDNMEDNQIVTPRRYFLDPTTWRRMDMPPVDFCKLIIGGNPRKFSAEVWKERDEQMKDVMIGETMGMQGSCWFMKRTWWDKVIGELQTEGYGPLIQDSHEMIFKTWKAGGKMMLNKTTWHAHKHRRFPRTHDGGSPENRANCNEGYQYALDVWEDYYKNVICPLWKI
jgi:glycosyltransferase involved in cell wall biosynthesis